MHQGARVQHCLDLSAPLPQSRAERPPSHRFVCNRCLCCVVVFCSARKRSEASVPCTDPSLSNLVDDINQISHPLQPSTQIQAHICRLPDYVNKPFTIQHFFCSLLGEATVNVCGTATLSCFSCLKKSMSLPYLHFPHHSLGADPCILTLPPPSCPPKSLWTIFFPFTHLCLCGVRNSLL